MSLAATLMLILVSQGVADAPETDPRDLLRRAQNHYAYGEYELAAPLLRLALTSDTPLDDAGITSARELLGLSAYLAGDIETARRAFTNLLLKRPEHLLDPFQVAPPIIEFFESIRKDLEPQLKALTQSQPTPEATPPRSTGRSQIVERVIVERSPLGLFMPFGYGQYQNGDTKLGHTLLSIQITALMMNIGSYYLARNYRRDPSLGQAFSQLQYASLAIFGLTWSTGVIQARLNFVPRVVRPPIIRQASRPRDLRPHIEAHALLTLETW